MRRHLLALALAALAAAGTRDEAVGGPDVAAAAATSAKEQGSNDRALSSATSPSTPQEGAVPAFVSPPEYAFVPVSLFFDDKNVRASRVRMCKLDFARYHSAPSVTPMVEDLIAQADCRAKPPNPAFAYDITLDELEQDYLKRGCDVALEAGELEPACAPSGLISHESRCGSTLISNMMASLPETLIYSELGPPNAVLRQPGLTFPERVHWLRVVYAGMARPIALAGYKRRLKEKENRGRGADAAALAAAEVEAANLKAAAVSGTALTDEQFIAQGAADWSPKYLYLKTQHTTSLYLDVYQASFPRMPWVYLHRDPIEVMMSLLRDTTAAPSPDAPLTSHINEKHMSNINQVPCMRTRVESKPNQEYLMRLLGQQAKKIGLDVLEEDKRAVINATAIKAEQEKNKEKGGGTGRLLLEAAEAAIKAAQEAEAEAEGEESSPPNNNQLAVLKDPTHVPSEDWCAADLSWVVAAAVRSALRARKEVLTRAAVVALARREAGIMVVDVGSGPAAATAPSLPGAAASSSSGAPVSAPEAVAEAEGAKEGEAAEGEAEGEGEEGQARQLKTTKKQQGEKRTTGAAGVGTNAVPSTTTVLLSTAPVPSPDRIRLLLEDTDVSSGSDFSSAVKELVPDCVTVRDGMILDADLEAGTILGVGSALFLDYTSLPHVVPLLLDSHLRPMSGDLRRQGGSGCLAVLAKVQLDATTGAAAASQPKKEKTAGDGQAAAETEAETAAATEAPFTASSLLLSLLPQDVQDAIPLVKSKLAGTGSTKLAEAAAATTAIAVTQHTGTVAFTSQGPFTPAWKSHPYLLTLLSSTVDAADRESGTKSSKKGKNKSKKGSASGESSRDLPEVRLLDLADLAFPLLHTYPDDQSFLHRFDDNPDYQQQQQKQQQQQRHEHAEDGPVAAFSKGNDAQYGGTWALNHYRDVQDELSLPPSAVNTMMVTSELYSKSRATISQLAALANAPGGIRPFLRTGSGRLRAARAWTSINAQGRYVSDTSAKQEMAWAALRAAAARFLYPLREVMARYNVPFTDAKQLEEIEALKKADEERSKKDKEKEKDKDGGSGDDKKGDKGAAPAPVVPPVVVEEEHPAVRDLRLSVLHALRASSMAAPVANALPPLPTFTPALLPLHADANDDDDKKNKKKNKSLRRRRSYPQLYPLSRILTEWNPDIVTPPGIYGKYNSLRYFDWTIDEERKLALQYRKAEVPFIVRNLPPLEQTVKDWADDDKLMKLLGGTHSLHKSTKPTPKPGVSPSPSPAPGPYYWADASESNHFLFYHRAGAAYIRKQQQEALKDKDKGAEQDKLVYKPPTRQELITFKEWIRSAYSVADEVTAEETEQLPSWWGNSEEDSPKDTSLSLAALPLLSSLAASQELDATTVASLGAALTHSPLSVLQMLAGSDDNKSVLSKIGSALFVPSSSSSASSSGAELAAKKQLQEASAALLQAIQKVSAASASAGAASSAVSPTSSTSAAVQGQILSAPPTSIVGLLATLHGRLHALNSTSSSATGTSSTSSKGGSSADFASLLSAFENWKQVKLDAIKAEEKVEQGQKPQAKKQEPEAPAAPAQKKSSPVKKAAPSASSSPAAARPSPSSSPAAFKSTVKKASPSSTPKAAAAAAKIASVVSKANKNAASNAAAAAGADAQIKKKKPEPSPVPAPPTPPPASGAAANGKKEKAASGNVGGSGRKLLEEEGEVVADVTEAAVTAATAKDKKKPLPKAITDRLMGKSKGEATHEDANLENNGAAGAAENPDALSPVVAGGDAAAAAAADAVPPSALSSGSSSPFFTPELVSVEDESVLEEVFARPEPQVWPAEGQVPFFSDGSFAELSSSPQSNATVSFTAPPLELLPFLSWHPSIVHNYGLPSRRPIVSPLTRSKRTRYYLHISDVEASNAANAAQKKKNEEEGGEENAAARRLAGKNNIKKVPADYKTFGWISEAFPFLAKTRPDKPKASADAGTGGGDDETPAIDDYTFFTPDTAGHAGIHCRFGQPGIIAESHYDTGRNVISMARGYRRYILLPPDQCPFLGLMKDGPSARHTALDWTTAHTLYTTTAGFSNSNTSPNPAAAAAPASSTASASSPQIGSLDPSNPSGAAAAAAALRRAKFDRASALEVVLEPGDVLYLPPLWFHFIVSLTVNIQCNARTGTPPLALKQLGACGFGDIPTSEELGEHTLDRALIEDVSGLATTRILPPLEYASLFLSSENNPDSIWLPSPSSTSTATTGAAAAVTGASAVLEKPIPQLLSSLRENSVAAISDLLPGASPATLDAAREAAGAAQTAANNVAAAAAAAAAASGKAPLASSAASGSITGINSLAPKRKTPLVPLDTLMPKDKRVAVNDMTALLEVLQGEADAKGDTPKAAAEEVFIPTAELPPPPQPQESEENEEEEEEKQPKEAEETPAAPPLEVAADKEAKEKAEEEQEQEEEAAKGAEPSVLPSPSPPPVPSGPRDDAASAAAIGGEEEKKTSTSESIFARKDKNKKESKKAEEEEESAKKPEPPAEKPQEEEDPGVIIPPPPKEEKKEKPQKQAAEEPKPKVRGGGGATATNAGTKKISGNNGNSGGKDPLSEAILTEGGSGGNKKKSKQQESSSGGLLSILDAPSGEAQLQVAVFVLAAVMLFFAVRVLSMRFEFVGRVIRCVFCCCPRWCCGGNGPSSNGGLPIRKGNASSAMARRGGGGGGGARLTVNNNDDTDLSFSGGLSGDERGANASSSLSSSAGSSANQSPALGPANALSSFYRNVGGGGKKRAESSSDEEQAAEAATRKARAFADNNTTGEAESASAGSGQRNAVNRRGAASSITAVRIPPSSVSSPSPVSAAAVAADSFPIQQKQVSKGLSAAPSGADTWGDDDDWNNWGDEGSGSSSALDTSLASTTSSVVAPASGVVAVKISGVGHLHKSAASSRENSKSPHVAGPASSSSSSSFAVPLSTAAAAAAAAATAVAVSVAASSGASRTVDVISETTALSSSADAWGGIDLSLSPSSAAPAPAPAPPVVPAAAPAVAARREDAAPADADAEDDSGGGWDDGLAWGEDEDNNKA